MAQLELMNAVNMNIGGTETGKRNTPIATLIKNFINKKSGRVSDSRKEIQWRFRYLDWKDQKKIILAFLDSCKIDRQWAYSMLLDYWDISFEPKVKELWEQLHEERCSWVVIRHFPVKYLSQNLEQFTADRDYFFVSLRLAADENYIIQKDKLSLTDYLSILHHTGRHISDDEAKDIPYILVHKICVERFSEDERQLDRYADSRRGNIISPIHFQNVSLALYYLRKLDCSHIVSSFETWNAEVQKTILNSPEFKAVAKLDLDEWDDLNARKNIARKYAYLALDDKYKLSSDPDIEEVLQPKDWYVETNLSKPKPIIQSSDLTEPQDSSMFKEMVAQNTALENLVDRFRLGVVNNFAE